MMEFVHNNIAVLEGDSCLSSFVKQTGRLDHDDILNFVTPMIKQGDCVVDVGAYIGGHTHAYLRAVGPKGQVYAIEPNPEARACLIHNCPKAIIKEFALGSKSSEGYFNFNANNPGASRLIEGNAQEYGKPSVDILPLDSLELSRLDFMKIDAEGWEPDVIIGGASTIKSCLPRIMMEINRQALYEHGWTANNLFALMEGLGYLPSTFGNDNLESMQLDVMFLHNEHKK